MPKIKKLSPIAELQVKAWVRAVLASTGKTARELEKVPFGDPDAPQKIEFALYDKAGRFPSLETIELVDAKFPDADSKLTIEVGPDGAPLWEVLSDECPDERCVDIVDTWLLPLGLDGQSQLTDSRMLALPFFQKLGIAFIRHAGRDVDLERFARKEEPNQVSQPFRDWVEVHEYFWNAVKNEDETVNPNAPRNVKRLIDKYMLSVHDVVGFIALRRLAESRRERRAEARYLFDGMLSLVRYAMMKHGIGEEMQAFLLPWVASASREAIEIFDMLLRTDYRAYRSARTPAKVAEAFRLMVTTEFAELKKRQLETP